MPLPPAESRALIAQGARRAAAGRPNRQEVIETLRRLGSEAETLVALFDARAIAGERHLLSAWAHLGRARGRGETRLRDRSAEFALYVAGDDQLPRALQKVGVSDSSDQFVVVVERPRSLAETTRAFQLIDDPSAFPRAADEATLDRLGISEEDRREVPRSGWEGLVLERVALIELSAAHAGAKPTQKA